MVRMRRRRRGGRQRRLFFFSAVVAIVARIVHFGRWRRCRGFCQPQRVFVHQNVTTPPPYGNIASLILFSNTTIIITTLIGFRSLFLKVFRTLEEVATAVAGRRSLCFFLFSREKIEKGGEKYGNSYDDDNKTRRPHHRQRL